MQLNKQVADKQKFQSGYFSNQLKGQPVLSSSPNVSVRASHPLINLACQLSHQKSQVCSYSLIEK